MKVGPTRRLVEDLGWAVGGDDRLSAAAAGLLLDVELPLHHGGDELVQLGHQAVAEPCEVVPAALGADLLIVAELVLDLAGDELALLLGVLSPGLQGGEPLGLGAGRVADGLGHRRHLLRPLAEDMTLELLQRALHRGERLLGGAQLSCSSGRAGPSGSRPGPATRSDARRHPLTNVDHGERGLSMGRAPGRSTWDGFQCCGRRTLPTSMPSSSMASCVASIWMAITDGSMCGSLNWPRSSRL